MALYVGNANEFGDQKHLHINSPASARCGNGDGCEPPDGSPIYFDDIHIAAVFGYTILCVDGPQGQNGGWCWGSP
jgi:hypothetical protein